MTSMTEHRWTTEPRVLLDHELRVVRANRSMCRSFGVRPDSLTGTRIEDWINVDSTLLYRLRCRIQNGSMPWHVILWLHLSGLQVLAVSQKLRPLRSQRNGYLLVSVADIQVA